MIVAGGSLGLALQAWTKGDQGPDLWFPIVVTLVLVPLAYFFWSTYIQADDATIVVKFGITRRYDRREVVAIRIGPFSTGSPRTGGGGRPARFLRSDGSVVFTTNVWPWGRDQLAALATYLRVPIGQS